MTQPATVLGAACPRGHFNDPLARFCRACGISMVHAEAAVEGVRPPLGALVIDHGRRVALDTDYLVGRAPRTSPLIRAGRARALVLGDAVAPLLLHIALEGWEVTAAGLDPRVAVTVVGEHPTTVTELRAGERVPLRSGDRLILGRRWLTFSSFFRT